MDKIIITIGGVSLMGLIYWFFFAKRSSEATVSQGGGDMDIKVDGGYKPEVIKLKKGKEVTLKLTRTDPNSCLEEFILPDFKVKRYLPLNEAIEIKLKPDRLGTFGFHCGMNMFHGKIVVE